MTRRNIFYNLEESCFKFKIENVVFYFSSKLHLQKFIISYSKNIVEINNSLSNRFKFKLNLKWVGILQTYTKIETRGFYLTKEGCVANCKEKVMIDNGLLKII